MSDVAHVPPASDPRHGGFVISTLVCAKCRTRIACITRRVERTDRTVTDIAHVRPGHIAIWCRRCRIASEYREAA